MKQKVKITRIEIQEDIIETEEEPLEMAKAIKTLEEIQNLNNTKNTKIKFEYNYL